MGLRGYLLVGVADDVDQQQFMTALREVEETAGVDFVAPVVGSYDMVILVDAPDTVESLANKIRAKRWVKNMETLRIVSTFERHRASKKEMLRALTHNGV